MLIRILLLIITSYGAGLQAQSDYVEYYRKGIQERDSGNAAAFLDNLRKADSLRPLHPTITYNLGTAYLFNGDEKRSIEYIRKSLLLNANMPFDTEENLERLQENPEYHTLEELRDSLLVPVSGSSAAIVLDENDLHVEGLAFDQETGNWYFGSVHKRKIIRRSASGEITEFKSKAADGLMAVMGLVIDPLSRILWVTSVPAREMVDADIRGPASILSYDLDSGDLIGTFSPPDEKDHWFGDLAIDDSGVVFITDSHTNQIYMIKGNELSLWYEGGPIMNIQGIDVDDDFVYVSDYLSTIYRISRNSKLISKLENTFDELILKGTDGLSLYRNSLLATINGLVPNRLIKLDFDPETFVLESYSIIDWNHPEYGEPTLGTVVGENFYYVGNSSWGAYTPEGELKLDELSAIKILSYRLD